jgi:glutathione peroxidase
MVHSAARNGKMQLTMPFSLRSPHLIESKTTFSILALALAACSLCPGTLHGQEKLGQEKKEPKQTVYDFSLVDQSGKTVSLSTYKGKLLLIVNLASQSIYSSQIAALNDLQKTYASQGLQIIGIPSADFGGEELKDPAALKKYYSETAHAEFPVFSSATITGVNEIPLYKFLCDPKQSLPGGDLHWNYTKFLVDREGHPLARYELDVDPADIEFHVNIEDALAGKLKKQPAGDKPATSGDDDDDN